MPYTNMSISVAAIRRAAQIFNGFLHPHEGWNMVKLSLNELEALEEVLSKTADAIELVIKEEDDERPYTLHS